jgi:hypothetical protein
MFRLSVRMAFGGGREQLVRLAVSALGVAIGVVLLLLAAVVLPAIHAHEAREAWTDTAVHNIRPAQDESRTDPLLWDVRYDGFDGRDVVRVDLAPLGPRAPLPPGLSRLPGPGELAVSPALARMLANVPPEQLADRYSGRIVATVGDAALRSPDSLVVFVGHDPGELRGRPGVQQVGSIESQPRSVSLTRFGRVVTGVGAAALLLPVAVLIATATRLAAARREQRLSAMRLVGASIGQIRMVAAVEAAIAAVAGTALGLVGFVAVRPYGARVDVDGSAFFVSDLRLSPWSALLVGLGVPALAVAVALLALRRVEVSPLGTSRQAQPVRPTWRRLIPLTVGVVGFAVSLPALNAAHGDWVGWAVAGIMAVLVLGIVIAGPWLTKGIGVVLVGLSVRPSTLLAGRRLAGDPAAGFRSISGLVLAVFLVTVASEVTASALAPAADPGQVRLPSSTVGQEYIGPGTVPLSADRADPLVATVRAMPGVTGVLDLRWAAATPPAERADTAPAIARCADLRAARLADCPDPAATVGLDASLLGTGYLHGIDTQPAEAAALDRLPLLALLVTTDGQPSTMEAVRTTIETTTAGYTARLPWTTGELKAQSHKQADQIVRISDAVLLATLLIAGFSLAVSVAGGLVERKRPFALLRLAGMRSGELRRVLLAETAGPLVTVALASAGLGMGVTADVAWVSHVPWRVPQASYWWVLGGGLALALGVATAATVPLLGRLTSLEAARFE